MVLLGSGVSRAGVAGGSWDSLGLGFLGQGWVLSKVSGFPGARILRCQGLGFLGLGFLRKVPGMMVPGATVPGPRVPGGSLLGVLVARVLRRSLGLGFLGSLGPKTKGSEEWPAGSKDDEADGGGPCNSLAIH